MTMEVREAARFVANATPGIPLPLVERLVGEGLRQFCKVARPWKLWLGPYDLLTDTSDYDLTPIPNGAVIDDIIRARIFEIDIPPFSVEQTEGMGEINVAQLHGFPIQTSYHRQTGSAITLNPPPSADAIDCLTVLVNLMPAPQEGCFLDIIWNEHYETIEQFVKWKAMIMPAEAWTNPELGAWHGQQYQDKEDSAANKTRSGNMTTRYRTVGNPWG